MRLILIIIGAGLLGIAAFSAHETKKFLVSAHSATGQVERLNAGGSHPQITFHTDSGERISYPQGGLIFGFRPGQTVTVLYNPSNPTAGPSVKQFGALWGNVVIEFLFGLLLIAAAAASSGKAPIISFFRRGR